MAVVNHSKREINAKIVYYGPGLSGKSTNLNHIFRRLKPEHRGKLKLMNIQSDRMLFFDFAPVVQTHHGYDLRFHIYTMTGEAPQPSAWKLLLKGVDGIVFVADSARDRLADNRESLVHLKGYLDGHRIPLHDFPLVFQCNKQDREDAVLPEEMRLELDIPDAPLIPAVAAAGTGILDSAFAVMKLIQLRLREQGLELDKDAEQPAGLQPGGMTATAPEAGDDLPEVAGPVVSAPGREVSRSVARPLLDFDGDVERTAGCLRLPLVVTCGDRKEKYTLTLSLLPSRTDG